MATNISKSGVVLNPESFQSNIEGKEVSLYFLKSNNITAAITNYGARLVALYVPDKNNEVKDVVLGFDTLENYLVDEDYHGAIVGRYANRIAKGKFSLNGNQYSLATNNQPNHLHGGIKGFSNMVWDVMSQSDNHLRLTYVSKDGEEGYPGEVTVNVDYTIADGKDLRISFEILADRTTIVNITNHSYFNLNGQGSGTTLNHRLQIFADRYTPIDKTSIPTGELVQVAGTAFDFRTLKKIGTDIEKDEEQLKNGTGYDHNFVLNKPMNNELSLAAKAIGDQSGIIMEVYTTEPGIQLYSGNFLEGDNTLKNGLKDDFRSAFCLETQHFPDSPNQTEFPTTVLQHGETYRSETIFRFSVEEALV